MHCLLHPPTSAPGGGIENGTSPSGISYGVYVCITECIYTAVFVLHPRPTLRDYFYGDKHIECRAGWGDRQAMSHLICSHMGRTILELFDQRTMVHIDNDDTSTAFVRAFFPVINARVQENTGWSMFGPFDMRRHVLKAHELRHVVQKARDVRTTQFSDTVANFTIKT